VQAQTSLQSFGPWLRIGILSFGFVITVFAHGQMTLSDAVKQAVRHSDRVAIAESDLTKAKATLSETRDAYIPSVSVSSGLGASSGITLNVPTVFTTNAQSLVFNSSQREYLRASHLGMEAAAASLLEIQQQVEEDTAATYFSLGNAIEKQAVLKEQGVHASRLVQIADDRLAAGFDTELEEMKARKEAAEIELQKLQLDDRISSLREHLAGLVGVSQDFMSASIVVSPKWIADVTHQLDRPCIAGADVAAAHADARAKRETSLGDSRYQWRPQVEFEAQYGRISPFNGVSTYYNLQGNYNTLAAGVQIQIPLLDFGRRARASVSAAEAAHAEHDALQLDRQDREACGETQHSLAELVAQYNISQLDYRIAAVEMQETAIRADGNETPTARPTTPKEKERALLQVGQKHLDSLAIEGQLLERYIHYLKQTGSLDAWVATEGQF
jgi:outer membrane protein TolC